MTYSEVLFIMAEAAQRGWDVGGETAETLYINAITANMEYWGVDAADIATYLANPEVTYDPVNFRKSIGDQKWISLYMNGIESWSEWRRLDYPLLNPAPDAVEGRDIPRRKAYAQREYDLNAIHVAEAVSRQGPDVMETKVWWDK
ncbi:MAG: SusD/RagB family nutrient-binding outer membrane lipoprotein [Cyclobacteriaceae bacterium]|nr:SusD/RagB family nutrient-binding outer membrane lipoprotein [Cyclobacteriaceae bacterium]